MTRLKNTDSFRTDASLLHAGKYSYDLVEYVNQYTRVKIVCQQHGIFLQTPKRHMQGGGCKKCSANLGGRIGVEEFVARSILVHELRYDYSLVKMHYDGVNTPVPIRCSIHGEFMQAPFLHYRMKCGCPSCGHERTDKANNTLTLDEFVRRANTVHDNLYDYSAIHIFDVNNINIVCRSHGIFTQSGHSHLNGKGCPVCSGNARGSTRSFIEKSRRIHLDRYQYDSVAYKNNIYPVTIVCELHGPFLQIPHNHLRGKGCPKCSHIVSKPSQQWLDSLGIPDDVEHREVRGLIPGKRYVVDGYDPVMNTVYEFHGDYWHGNPVMYPSDGINPSSGVSYGEHYKRTQQKHRDFTDAGYQLVTIWESDFTSLDPASTNT